MHPQWGMEWVRASKKVNIGKQAQIGEHIGKWGSRWVGK